MNKADLELAVIAWRKRWEWNGHHWPTENERMRAVKHLEKLADQLIDRLAPQGGEKP